MFTDIFLVVMLETAETTGVKQDKNNHNLSITHTVGFVTMIGLLILNHIFFLLKCKFLAKIIGHTINLCNFRLWKHSGNRLNVIIQRYKFNTFIAMFLIISEIYLFLYRTHVKYLSPQKIKFSYPQIYPKIYFRQENHHNRQNNSLSLSYIVLKIPL